jgi:RNA recognition motif-containing protein
MDKYSGRSKGFGFVEMPVGSEAQSAMNSLNGKELRVERGATEDIKISNDNLSFLSI